MERELQRAKGLLKEAEKPPGEDVSAGRGEAGRGQPLSWGGTAIMAGYKCAPAPKTEEQFTD